MNKHFNVFGLEQASYDSLALGIRSLASFETLEQAEEWFADQFNDGETIKLTEPPRASFALVTILPIYVKAE